MAQFNPVGSFQAAKGNALSLRQAEQNIDQGQVVNKNRNALADFNLSQRETEFNQSQLIKSAKLMNNSFKALRSLPLESRAAGAETLRPLLAKFGITEGFTIDELSDVSLDSDIAESGAFLQDPTGLSSGQRERADLIKAVAPALNAQGQIDVSKLDANSKSAAMALGLIPKSGTVTGAERIATDPTLSADVAGLEGLKAAKKETGKLTAQLKLKPEVEAAVVSAVAQAKADAGIADEGRSNEKAFAVYEAAVSGLTTALSGTITGPGVGYLPALTSNAQLANASVAMMAPVLKQIFRAAGEGSFSDGDQKLLIGMIPTRDTLPEARVAALAAIDAIVRAKIGSPSAPQQAASGKGEGKIMIDANGNRARVFPDGSFEEL